MPETRRYSGGCHCGRVRYEVTTDLVFDCNCSICRKRGALRRYVEPGALQLTPCDGRSR